MSGKRSHLAAPDDCRACVDKGADGEAAVVVAAGDGELAWGEAVDGAAHDAWAVVDQRVSSRQQDDADARGDEFERLVGVVRQGFSRGSDLRPLTIAFEEPHPAAVPAGGSAWTAP
jgi:hypothetical protein